MPSGRTAIPLPVAAIARRYRKGAGLWTLAREYGVSTGTIRTRLMDFGVILRYPGFDPGTPNTSMARADHPEIVAAYLMGDPIAAIAADRGLSSERIQQILTLERCPKNRRGKGRPRGGYRASAGLLRRDEEILQAHQRGEAMAAIGAAHKISRQRVHQILRGIAR